jgi:hypothetical protein
MDGVTGLLPGGYWDDGGTLHRDFELAPLTGRDEELLAQSGRAESASLVTAVLSRAVRRVGDISPISEHVARQLLVADRQYLLLKLRRSTFGGIVRGSVFCPWRDCGERVSLQFQIDDVPVQEACQRAPHYTMSLSSGSDVCFRLPNGSDQETVSPLVARNEAEALTRLLARAIHRLGAIRPPAPEDVAALSPFERTEIEAEMERLSPKIELNLDTSCSECGRSFVVPFNLQQFFFGELRAASDLLYREIHYLAYHYHWSEREILEMPRDKRQKYIEVLADEIERLNSGA